MLKEVVGSALESSCSLHKGDKIVLAFSGGSDSMCLLHVLSALPYDVVVAYFNHHLRAAAAQEVRFANDMAKKYGFQCEIGSKDIKSAAQGTGMGVEEAAREFRYQFLLATANKYQAQAVAAAHHADDQVETIMLNLIRGSGLNGLTGMQYRTFHAGDDHIPIIRPMLGIWKKEILEFCRNNSLLYQEDHTNLDIAYTRNNLRQNIIPEMEKINPGFKHNLLRMQTILIGDEQILQDQTLKHYKNICHSEKKNILKIDGSAFQNLQPGLQRRIVRRGLEAVFDMVEDISFQMVEDICRVINGDIGAGYMQINDHLIVKVEKDSTYIYTDHRDLLERDALLIADDTEEIHVHFSKKTSINQYWVVKADVTASAEMQNLYKSQDVYTAYFDADMLQDPLIIRRWVSGDRFAPLGMHGKSMKLSDFWINKKLPKRYRGDWPLVCSQNNILWIPGFQPSVNAVITSKTKRVLKLQFLKAAR